MEFGLLWRNSGFQHITQQNSMAQYILYVHGTFVCKVRCHGPNLAPLSLILISD